MNKTDVTFFGVVKIVLTYAATIALCFIVIEGFSSAAISLVEMMEDEPLPSPSQYDEELGWTSVPNTYSPHFYGPGKYIRTNAQGFRNEADTALQVPVGKIRIVCSGDSFTFGQGVANDRTWCHRLSKLDDQFETVNLGQPRYGIDQAYLRYLRDAADLDQTIHIFAFVSGNFNRMSGLDYQRHGKPALELVGNELNTVNVPVPRFRWRVSRGLERADFRSIDFAQRVLARLSPQEFDIPEANKIRPVAARVFETLQQLDTDNGITSLFVFLPTQKDIDKDRAWRGWITTTMYESSMPFIDLTPALRELAVTEQGDFFIPDGTPSAGLYNERGNEWVAQELYRRLSATSRVGALPTRTVTGLDDFEN